MKIFFCGGGTAGHVSPALAMAEQIRLKYQDAEIFFIGREGGDENRAIIREGYPLFTLSVEGISRSLSPKNVIATLKAVAAVSKARKILQKNGADMVIGTGGYVSWAPLRAAAQLGIPRMIHEANAYPGLVTRLLARKCSCVMLGFAEASKHIQGAKAVYTVGNPTKEGFGRHTRTEARRALGIPDSKMLIVSFGGSLGAKSINDAVIGFMRSIKDRRYLISHIHAVGRRYWDSVLSESKELCEGARGLKIVPYIDNMPLWLCAADLVISRSGAMTLAELQASRVPAILIPSPNVTGDHQLKNAEAARERGSAILIRDEELTPGSLGDAVLSLYRDRRRLNAMGEAYGNGFTEAADDFIDVFEKYYPF